MRSQTIRVQNGAAKASFSASGGSAEGLTAAPSPTPAWSKTRQYAQRRIAGNRRPVPKFF
jgi:hypothetical protein